MFVMADYSATEGKAGEPPERWPNKLPSELTTENNKPTLVMFAHPLCPCTRATLWELESMANRLHGLFTMHILFFEPENSNAMPDVWEASDLKTIANRLPGTSVHVDVEGEIARHFGAYTSGQVLLYDTNLQLAFTGGITPSRGHTGTNPGKARIISSILSDSAVDPLKPSLHSVYGCSLHSEEKDDRKIKIQPSIALTKPASI